jgi:acetyl-CoA carboxylase alpha subunit
VNTTQVLLHPLQSEWDADLRGGDPLTFPGYDPPAEESVVTGRTVAGYALIQGRFDVLGGSMGAAHGERVVRAYRRATEERLPVVVVAASGGARMHEGMVSLIQLPRTAAAAAAHSAAGLLQLAILRSPTTGGVYASYASLADVKAGEPGATIGFAGPRVVELTTGEAVGPTSHTAESAYAAGLLDALVLRDDQAAWVESVLAPTRLGSATTPLRTGASQTAGTAWEQVQLARSGPSADEWAEALCGGWTELRSNDPAMTAALTTFEGRRVVVIAMRRTARPGPAGYELAQRAIALASKLGAPLLTFVDTPGADPSPKAENEGVAREIARTLAQIMSTPVPTVSVVTGEGGSGGALAIAATDRILMLEHAVFSVIAPEGAAAILDRTPDTARQRANDLKLTAADLLALGIVDEVLQETEAAVTRAIARALDEIEPGRDRHRRFDAATERWLR